MFIINGKSHRCNDTYTRLVACKEYLRIQIIFKPLYQHFICYFV